ncbi:MAG: transcriptional regulator, MerR family [Proteobacteria bacterium]|nr:transcriptional regulator, MerR family [Pseudomonadota bacterium]
MLSTPSINISDIERETGLGKDLLRKWRSRYGFPGPSSDDGDTGYSRDQVNQLRLIRRLLDAGMRPKQVVGKSSQELEKLARLVACSIEKCTWPASTHTAIEMLKKHDLNGLRGLLAEERTGQALPDFIRNTVAPLSGGLGDAWAKGEIEVYHEHLCTSMLIRQLQAEIEHMQPKAGFPRFIFSTLREELHTLGLLMAQAVLMGEGAECIDVGPQMPIADLDMAARKCQADVIALSFSPSFPKRTIRPLLLQLRERLPNHIEIWAGGAGASVVKRPPQGIRIFSDLHEPVATLCQWVGRTSKQ